MSKIIELCCDCGQSLNGEERVKNRARPGMGYGLTLEGQKICYACCAKRDEEEMRANGKITLYLTGVAPKIKRGYVINDAWLITNWPGSLKFTPMGQSVKVSQTNWGLNRYDVWFAFEGFIWHGVSIGDNSELLRCKRTKQLVKPTPKAHWVGMAGLHGYMPNYITVGRTRGQCAEDLGQIHELSGRKIKQMRRDNYLELDLYTHGNEYCEIVECDCGKDISSHDDDLM